MLAITVILAVIILECYTDNRAAGSWCCSRELGIIKHAQKKCPIHARNHSDTSSNYP